MRPLTPAVTLIVTLLMTCNAFADPRSMRFEHLSREHGLSQAFVYAILQDAEGYLWFGTQEGLNRYDGFNFRVFANEPGNPKSISDDAIRTMIRDRNDTLWIGTDAGGLSRYEAVSESFTNYLHDSTDPDSISDNRVRVVYEDGAGRLWIGTDGSGLDLFERDSGTFVHFAANPLGQDGPVGNRIWDILEGQGGSLWIATDAGLSRLDPATGIFSHIRHDANDLNSLGDNSVRVLYEDADGYLWIGTDSGGLNRLDPERARFDRFVHDPMDGQSLGANRVNAIYEDDGGILWIATVNGLNSFDPASQTFQRYVSNPGDRYSLTHNNVQSLFQDRGGVLWIGTYNGLCKWNPATRAMLHYRNNADDPASLAEDTVTSFAEDHDGALWVGTYGGGLNQLDRDSGAFEQVRHSAADPRGLASDEIMTLAVDRDGALWIGTRFDGLQHFDASSASFTSFRHDPADPASLSADGVTDILEDRDGGLWVATFGGGLNYRRGNSSQFIHYKHDPDDPLTLSNNRVLTLYEDSAGILWAGTYGGGLSRIDRATGRITTSRHDASRADSLGGDEVYVIVEDARGDLWIGIKGAGLNRWRREAIERHDDSFEHFGELDGLPSNTVYSAVRDRHDHLWFSSSAGLSRLDVDTLEFRNYHRGHGLQGDEFNHAAGFRASDGRLYFGGINGFNAFDPDALNGRRVAPQVVITKVLALGEPVAPEVLRSTDQPVRFHHDQNVIGFEFAALDYTAPEQNRYMYRMDGLDDAWVDAGTLRRVTYNNLPAGNHTFRVRAANHDGVWSEQDSSLSLYMAPPSWNTWWARSLYVIAFVALAVTLLRSGMRRSAEKARFRYADEMAIVQTRMNEAQRIASIGNWEWDIVNDRLWWSDEIYRIFQKDRASFGANHEAFLESVHPDDRQLLREAVDRTLAGDAPYSIDYRIVCDDGTERVVHERAEVVFNDNGQPMRLAGTVHDITDRKAAEIDIRRRAEFQGLLATLSSKLIRSRPDQIDTPMRECLETIGARYDLDAVTVWWFEAERESLKPAYRWSRDTEQEPPSPFKPDELPLVIKQLSDGECVAIDDVDSMSAEAAKDAAMLARHGIRSLLIVPLLVNEVLQGAGVFPTYGGLRSWPAATIAELRLVAELLGGALDRSIAMAEVRKLKDELQDENLYLRQEVRLAHGFSEIIGEDAALKRCLQAVEKVAPTDVAVLILGETGTGKELIARAVHDLSNRRDNPMISVNCPTLPGNLIESELFGHEKGAFTGAESRRRGRFELADGGTIFLDEIGELPLDLQSKLLRVLQTGEFERLGGTETLHVDVRLIAATNRNLQQAIERGEFRADLYYRISSFPISLPSLRARRDDIPLLAEHFVHKYSRRLGKTIDALSANMLKELMNYKWPGNVRELESIIERSLISAENSSVLELPGPLRLITRFEQSRETDSNNEDADLLSVERTHIVEVLERTNWKVSGEGGAADVLGMPSSTLRSKMKRLDIRRQ